MESFGRQYGFETTANQRNSQSPGRFGGGRTFQSYDKGRSDFGGQDGDAINGRGNRDDGFNSSRGGERDYGSNRDRDFDRGREDRNYENNRGRDFNASRGDRTYEHNTRREGTSYESNRGGDFNAKSGGRTYEHNRGGEGTSYESNRGGSFGGRSSYSERGDSFPSQQCDSGSEMSSRLGSPEGSLEQSSFRRVLVKDDQSNECHSPPRSSNAHAGGNTTGDRGGSAKRPFNQDSPSEGETVPEEDPMQRQIRELRLKRLRQVADISDVCKPTIKPIDSRKPLVPRRGLKSIFQAEKKIQRLLMKKEDLLKKMARPDCEEKARETGAHVLVSIDEALDIVRDVLSSMKNQ